MKENNSIKVSIIIPVYNGSNYLAQAIDSALAQTYKNIEVIVINDGSNDEGATEKIALSYGDKIKYFAKENGGVASALNSGIEKMNGDYFSWLSHDDLYIPNKIETQLKALKSCGKNGVVYSGFEYIDAEGKKGANFPLSPHIHKNIKTLLAMDTTTTLHGCSLLVPKEYFIKYGVFNTNLKTTQDYDMWFRIAKHEVFIPVNELLVLSRVHAEQDSKKKEELCTYESDELHCRLIDELSSNDVLQYTDNSVQFIINAYKTYLAAGYAKTPVAILRLITKSPKFLSDKTLQIFLNKQIFHFGNPRQIMEEAKKINAEPLKKRIVFFNDVWNYGGVERVLSLIMPQIAEDYEVFLIYYHSAQEGFELESTITKIELGDPQNDPGIRAVKLAAILKAELFINNCNIFLPVLSIYEELQKLGIKSIAVNHYSYFLPYIHPSLKQILPYRAHLLAMADAAVWLTSFNLSMYSYINDNGFMLHNPSTFEIDDSGIPEEKILLAVGRFQDTIKRLDKTLILFSKISERVPDVKLIIVGRYEPELTFPPETVETIPKLTEKLGIASKVTFLDEQKDVTPFYKKAKILLMTSESEGFGMVLTEAASFGVPSAILYFPGCEDIITDEENGFTAPQDDLDSLAEKVSNLLTNPSLYAKMHTKTIKMAGRFNKRKIGGDWKKLIALILGSKTREELRGELKKARETILTDSIFKPSKYFPAGIEALLKQVVPFEPDSLIPKKELHFKLSPEQFHKKLSPAEKQSFAQEINRALLNSSSMEETIDIIDTLSNFKNNGKPTLMFHIYGWLKGGAERTITNLTTALVEKYNIIIAPFEPFNNTDFHLHKGLLFIKLFHKDINRLIKLTEFIKPDIFIGNNNSLPQLLTVYPKLKKLGIKTIAWCHEHFFFIHNHKDLYPYASYKHTSLQEADAVIFLTKFSAYAYQGINNNGVVIPNSNTYTEHSTPESNFSGKKIIGVGRFNDPIKRIDKLLVVFSKLLKHHPDAVLTLAGPFDEKMALPEDKERTVEDLLNELKIPEGSLNIMGECKELDKLYQKNNILIMTSDNEGFGMVLTKALQLGLVPLAFYIPALEDIITDGENGFLIADHNNIEGMVDKLSYLMANPEKIKEISERAVKFIRRFDISEVSKKWDALISTLLKGDKITSNLTLTPEEEDKFEMIIAKEYEEFTQLLLLRSSKLAFIKIMKGLLKKISQFRIGYTLKTIIKNIQHYGIKDTIYKIIKVIKN